MTNRESFIERVLHEIERRIERWREQDSAREAEVEAGRALLWAEAAEREKLLKQIIDSEETWERPLEEVAEEHRVVFVVHSEGAGRALRGFAARRISLMGVVPGRGSYGRGSGVKGSWLVFEHTH